jgi:hypothetical protein
VKKLSLALILGAAAVGGIAASAWWLLDRPPKPLISYRDLTLGMSMPEVFYTKGPPTNVEEDDVDQTFGRWSKKVLSVSDIEKQPNKNDVKDYFDWDYEDGTSPYRIDVAFSPKTRTVSKIGCYVNSASFSSGECSLLGLSAGSSEEAVRKKLGRPSQESIDGVTKVMTYNGLDLTVFLTKQKAYMFVIGHDSNDAK